MNKNMRYMVVALLAALVLALPASALAVTSSEDAYGGKAAEQQQAAEQQSSDKPDNSAKKADTGSLPFTGFQVGFALAAGAALLGTGLVVRRAAGTGPHA